MNFKLMTSRWALLVIFFLVSCGKDRPANPPAPTNPASPSTYNETVIYKPSPIPSPILSPSPLPSVKPSPTPSVSPLPSLLPSPSVSPSPSSSPIPTPTVLPSTEARGIFDHTFGVSGAVLWPSHSGTEDRVANLQVSSTGEILSAGVQQYSTKDYFVSRLGKNGSFDSSFGGGGTVLLNFGSNDVGWGVIPVGNSKFIAYGMAYTSQSHSLYAVARLNSNGLPDITFGNAGFAKFDLGNGINRLGKVVQTSDGKLLLIGYRSPDNARFSGAVMRLHANGSIDTSFGTNGTATFNYNTNSLDQVLNGVLQSDGKLVVTGLSSENGKMSASVFRLTTTGKLDLTFAISGKLRFNFGNNHAQGATIAITSENKILVGGTSYSTSFFDGSADFGLARFTKDGILDPAFGVAGVVSTHFGQTEAIRALTVQSNGKIVAVGESLQGKDFLSPSVSAVARYNLNGTLDDGFGVGGKYTFGLSTADYPFAVALQADGAILVGGGSKLSSNSSRAFIFRIR